MSDKYIPQALFFELNKEGIPRRVVNTTVEPHKINGFWATVIRRFPETECEEISDSLKRQRLWLVRKENGSYMLVHEQGNAAHVHTEAVLLFGERDAYAETYFDMMKNALVLPQQIYERIEKLETDPEDVRWHWKRAMRIIRDDLAKCELNKLLPIAATLGSNLSAERLKLRPKRALPGERVKT